MLTQYRSNAVIALGGNLPFQGADPKLTLRKAIERGSEMGLVIRGISQFYRTPCFPAGAGPDYVNAAIRVETELPPAGLLQVLHDIEHEFGRAREQRWGMRTLDLDVLLFEDLILPDRKTFDQWHSLPLDEQVRATPEQLILPHPRLQDRAFALVPACDVAPDWRHPVSGKTIRELTADLPADALAEVVAL
ncbi:2-amino-4-hydroxy-6-hydroxymethyldihydropteridinepyrophosphokinase [Falsiruegeria litorea R37]|uniref:2-amino-4-hydroxy-6-hydroxymethyldihydropteridine pyrophosphokinase n=1 Tax=Falsiruegeria litorea R37 TaxID=1200284 RepID=A0A1Y5RNU7_9RHOB|nr:2-amino-4-hydroxy-6-hydroxymethyldihydropteridine diphosphokinase [Falsiruegeria litorea]SLN21951.1 2-amino-4-hydroxy-6-hydroxymethyldihydropteridinepyrophosphokinase [Falsiruegeria litorea R37]